MDPKDLNTNIKREHYQIPKREEIVNEMTGAKYFSKMDATDSVWGSTQEEHDTKLEKTLWRVQQFGFKLNGDKCQFSVSEITFLGDKISTEGVQPDKAKVKAIHDMEKPKDKKGVQWVLGMLNYLGKFIPNLSMKTAHLRKLLHQETEFQWGHEHETEWKGLLHVLASEPLLMFFCPEKRTKVSTDASKDGLGAVLLQEDEGAWRPVAYVSHSMMATGCRYAQIEKECLG
ncbi:hypothetical protein SKAU_G00092490 [Synaphobranchus kaupii]|uniref:Reverse transcriptase/retrotransposon-derived protein RNase H-like domain-containing protein n=1 Tax=Synaphobranchus kaupii TaxID=118154 RepID=A0A9Q1FWZ8_SYNKA|nr:hypothetical protein SKAU_G00092490 [Synaphobranchus kaupii]